METNVLLPEYIFDFIYGEAMNDATRRTNAASIKNTDLDRTALKGRVKKYVESLINGENPNFCDWVEGTENILKKAGINEFTFGNIQKLVNMTIKYLYVRYYDNEEIKSRLKLCDAPMDRIMVCFVYESYYVVQGTTSKEKRNIEKPGFEIDCAWSNLTNNCEYNAFQKAIDIIIEKKKLDISRIEFDYMYWEKAKTVKYDENGKERKQDERIKKTIEIWRETSK